MLNAKVAAFLETLDGAGHVPYNQYHDQIVSQSDYFFYDFLDLASRRRAGRRLPDAG